MSFTDALSRISEIQQQMTALSDGTLLSASTSTASTRTSTATTDGSGTATTAFADALAQAQGGDSTDATATTATPAADSGATGGAGLTASSVALPATASSELTSSQKQFAQTLSADTGLNPGVVCAWLLSEENGSAAQSRQAANNNDWLNIGYTDSGTYGASDSIWSDPVSAANATAAWLAGKNSIPGYGTASSGVQSILSSVGQSPQAQISALQNSGWASGGYPELAQVYSQVAG